MPQSIYYFNPKTLSFEKKKFSWKDIVKRVVWFLATALAFSVVIVWISFYLINIFVNIIVFFIYCIITISTFFESS